MSTEVLEKSTDIETATTEALSSETISDPVLVQAPVEEIIIEGNKPVLKHGRLKLDGLQIVDQSNAPLQLRGVSTHGIQWFPEYVSLDTFRTMRDDWHINVVRLALYTDPNAGYDEKLHALVEKGVAYAIELDLYVIIDWHILSDGDPNLSKDRAIKFFEAMSRQYKDNPNVLYEICNEPNGDVTWASDIKPYAESIINVIRQNDKNALIIVGTPTWSQDVDFVANDPIEHQENILYALHFYAATHKDDLREKLSKALKLGLPIIVSEFGISDASGSGEIDYEQGTIWLDFLESHGIGYVAWNLSNKKETSALISSDVNYVSGWNDSDLTPWGLWFVNRIREK
ncbi:glycoside hydrolase family 5 protein [Fusibacter sp. 3D3]|uniref:glycoside hydrolase family 5 protein n=1 Tax=Fusibacter sp. 3D3 TaxID=1048380 RepID=UPI000853AFAB|nr:glycoside hydrolase family 5 protein [Fusibacter sp. 3D3]GAU78556.1 endo-1,4-beta-xylanase A precursor [Fusibacter sp. 3D3]